MKQRPLPPGAPLRPGSGQAAPPSRLVPVRGPSGKLYGMLDPATLVMEFKQGNHIERIDLSVYRQSKGE